MDVLGHVLLGAAVAGELSPYTVACSLLPDLASLPLQRAEVRRNIEQHPRILSAYKLAHSPLALLLAWFLPDPGFLLVATHIVSDMFTHDRPYSEFPIYQWEYRKASYWLLVTILGGIACLRLFF